ncbi:MAG: hypothetical protein WBE13_11520 [Candidatus Acidiferrum sp.]
MSTATTAQRIAAEQMDTFLDLNKDLLACIRETPEEIFRRTSAAASLDQDTRDDLERYVTIVDQENAYAKKVAHEDLARTIYSSIAKHFIELMNNGTFHFAMKLTDLADQQQLNLHYECGLLERPAPPPAPLSAKEQLENEVVADFEGAISADKMKIKMNNRAYRNTYNRLAETDRLRSQITRDHRIGEVGG